MARIYYSAPCNFIGDKMQLSQKNKIIQHGIMSQGPTNNTKSNSQKQQAT